jgi:hypothetical protein
MMDFIIEQSRTFHFRTVESADNEQEAMRQAQQYLTKLSVQDLVLKSYRSEWGNQEAIEPADFWRYVHRLESDNPRRVGETGENYMERLTKLAEEVMKPVAVQQGGK